MHDSVDHYFWDIKHEDTRHKAKGLKKGDHFLLYFCPVCGMGSCHPFECCAKLHKADMVIV